MIRRGIVAAQVVLLAVTCSVMSAPAADATSVSLGGYIKFDSIFSEYSDGKPANDSPLRDFHVPSLIPVDGTGSDFDAGFHAKQSRIFLDLRRKTDGGHRLSAMLEVDFLLSEAGDERITNSYNPRLRHAYLKYDDWLFGQSWSTFMILALPEDLDLVGVADGTTFGRAALIQLTRGPWQFALENPDTTITPNGGGARIESQDSVVPDIVARYNFKHERGKLSAAGILRRLELDDGVNDSSTSGWGVSVGGDWSAGERDTLIFQINNGRGLGRYLALNAANGAVLTAAGELDAIDSSSAFVGLRHEWNDRWRSNVNFSGFWADQEAALSGGDATRSSHSYSINALYSPVPLLTFGAEYMHAEREVESGSEGDLDRIQFSAKYAFNYSTGASR